MRVYFTSLIHAGDKALPLPSMLEINPFFFHLTLLILSFYVKLVK